MAVLPVAWLVQTLHSSFSRLSVNTSPVFCLVAHVQRFVCFLQVSSMTMSRLDAGMWENPASASSLQHRLLVELAALPASVLSEMVRHDPPACLC